MVPSNEPDERPPSHEATLSCPSCDHANLINGDWLITVRADHLDYECPECATTIDSRCEGVDLATRSHGALRVGAGD
jgi:predicted RNA-binding Zn-ribbon protein involved in translation (DUF1610 family)